MALDIKLPWKVVSAVAIGYPTFPQLGMAAREDRPITWYRPGKPGPEIEE